MSCSVPMNFIHIKPSKALVLRGNKFFIQSVNLWPHWLLDTMRSATFMFIDETQVIWDYFLLLICGMCSIICGVIAFLKWKESVKNWRIMREEWNNFENEKESRLFFRQIESGISMLRKIWIFVVLILLYHFGSPYFECTSPLQSFSLTNISGDSIIYSWIIAIVLLISNSYFLYLIFQLNSSTFLPFLFL